jgi:hypothetical protein
MNPEQYKSNFPEQKINTVGVFIHENSVYLVFNEVMSHLIISAEARCIDLS